MSTQDNNVVVTMFSYIVACTRPTYAIDDFFFFYHFRKLEHGNSRNSWNTPNSKPLGQTPITNLINVIDVLGWQLESGGT